jgi:hypothetical protein
MKNNQNRSTRPGRREPFQKAVERIDEFLKRNRQLHDHAAIDRIRRRLFGVLPEDFAPSTNAPATPESLSGHEGVA